MANTAIKIQLDIPELEELKTLAKEQEELAKRMYSNQERIETLVRGINLKLSRVTTNSENL